MSMTDCFTLTCIECGRFSFTKAGERFAVTRVCRRCEQGWTSSGASTTGGPKTSLKPKPKPRTTKTTATRKKTTKKPEPIQTPVESSNPHSVAPGQVWESLDPRDNGRRIEVLEVNETHAEVLSAGARRRKVKLSGFTRLKGRGYQRVTGNGHRTGRGDPRAS